MNAKTPHTFFRIITIRGQAYAIYLTQTAPTLGRVVYRIKVSPSAVGADPKLSGGLNYTRWDDSLTSEVEQARSEFDFYYACASGELVISLTQRTYGLEGLAELMTLLVRLKTYLTEPSSGN